MKTIVYRGGVVTFRIPAHWLEEYSDMDGGTFYEDRPDSGTLRLKIMTARTPTQVQSTSSLEVLDPLVRMLKEQQGAKGSTRKRSDGNAVFKYEEHGFDDGVKLTVFYWVIANPLPPCHARLATFSYTIVANQLGQSHIQRDLEMLEAEIEAASFARVMGTTSG